MGIVRNIRQAYWSNADNPACKKCHVYLRRAYVRDVYYVDEFGKKHDRNGFGFTKKREFVPIGWVCPECGKLTLDAESKQTSKEQTTEAVKCHECKSTNTVFRKQRGQSKQYQCRDCKAYFSIKENSKEQCPECGAEVDNPDKSSELTCDKCGESFTC